MVKRNNYEDAPEWRAHLMEYLKSMTGSSACPALLLAAYQCQPCGTEIFPELKALMSEWRDGEIAKLYGDI